MSEERFEEWCVLEIMGHQRYVGLVSDHTIGGASFVRIDVPEVDGAPAFSKLFGASSIYCITPISEELARAKCREMRQRPLPVYEMPAALPAPSDDDYDDYP